MKKALSLASTAMVVLSLVGCASAGNRVLADQTSRTVAQQIVIGKSTQQDARRIYDDPMKADFTDNGNLIWHYEFPKAHSSAVSFVPVVGLFAGGVNGTKKELVVFFDKHGVVKNYSMNSSAISARRF